MDETWDNAAPEDDSAEAKAEGGEGNSKQMKEAWALLLADLELSEKGRYPALEGLSAASSPDLDGLYARILSMMVEGISATYGID